MWGVKLICWRDPLKNCSWGVCVRMITFFTVENVCRDAEFVWCLQMLR